MNESERKYNREYLKRNVILPKEPEHGWSPYERFQDRARDITSIFPDAEEYLSQGGEK